MVTLKPIKLLPARERVASALRKAIISKQIGEGEVITLEATAQQLGVSVTPVREAFQILARDGLIDLKQNKGATVLGLNETTIREHYEIRAALESAACVLCCQRKADLSDIRKCLEMADEALEKKDSSSYSNYNQSFHYEIWTAAFEKCGLSIDFYNTRERSLDEVFPWDFIDTGVTKAFYKREWERAMQEKITPNCRQSCSGCGAKRFGGGVCFENQNSVC